MQKLLLSLSVAVLLRYGTGQEVCTPPAGKPGCVCDVEGQGTIDLTSLSDNNNPRFSYIYDSGSYYTYSYNPCYGFMEGSGSCSYYPVSGCQDDPSDPYTQFSLGDPSTETMYYNRDTDDRYLEYDSGQEGRSMIVHLQCDETAEEPDLTADGDIETQLTYVFHLRTKCACPGGCADETHAPPTTHSGNTGGSSSVNGVASGYIGIILMMFILAGLITYFVVGIVINHVRFEKRGVELIPHRHIWFSIPLLVKDGFVFTFGPLVEKIRGRSLQYDKI